MAEARIPEFEVAADEFGRDAGGLGPSGAYLNIDLSAVAAGGFLPGDRDDMQNHLWMIRITATKDCYIQFSLGAATATNDDMLFQAGTEAQKLPTGTNYVSAIAFNPADTGKLQIALLG